MFRTRLNTSCVLFFFGLNLALNLTIPKNVSGDEPYLKLCFASFLTQSFLPASPMTMETVCQVNQLLFVQEHQFASELLRRITSHPPNEKFNPQAVRLKADFGSPEGVYFVDQAGTVIKQNSTDSFRLSLEDMKRLEIQLRNFVGVIDVNAHEKYMKEHKK